MSLTNTKFIDFISSGRTIIFDGAMGTQLQKLTSLPSGYCLEELNISRPEEVRRVHAEYIDAGAEIIVTNTFGANRIRLKLYSFENRVREFNTVAVKLAREASHDKNIFVAGSIGPSGEILEPLGTLTETDLMSSVLEQAEALISAGVDFLLVETLMDLQELLVIVKTIKSHFEIPLAVSMSFEKGKTGFATPWGVTPKEFVDACNSFGVSLLGANCGKGFHEFSKLSEILMQLSKIPVFLKANAGIPIWENGISTYKVSPESIIPDVHLMLKAGVRGIGGCCGTTPDFIRVINSCVSSFAKT